MYHCDIQGLVSFNANSILSPLSPELPNKLISKPLRWCLGLVNWDQFILRAVIEWSPYYRHYYRLCWLGNDPGKKDQPAVSCLLFLFPFCGTCSFSLFWKMNIIKNERETGSTINDQTNAIYNVWRKINIESCHLQTLGKWFSIGIKLVKKCILPNWQEK